MLLEIKKRCTSLEIDDNILSNLVQLGLDHHPKECGGFLMGCYSDDFRTLEIKTHIFPKVYFSTPISFDRSAKGVEKIFRQLYTEEGYYYIGEWHTHPNGSSQHSPLDLDSMIKIATSDSVRILNPILLILNMDKSGLRDFSCYLYDEKELIKYEQY